MNLVLALAPTHNASALNQSYNRGDWQLQSDQKIKLDPVKNQELAKGKWYLYSILYQVLHQGKKEMMHQLDMKREQDPLSKLYPK